MQQRAPHIAKTSAGSSGIDAAVQDFAERLRRTKSLDTAWRAICQAYADNGIDYVIYMFMRPAAPHDTALVRSNMPRWWADYYDDEGHAQHDPFFKTCGTFAPTRTGSTYVDDHADVLTREEQRFIREAGETGLISGIASPVRLQGPGHFGGWNLGTGMKRAPFEKHLAVHCDRLQLMGFIAHETLQKMTRWRSGEDVSERLSERERECLLWLARGLRIREIADRLGIASVTVDLHLRRVRAKLRAATREEALAKAILSGEIVP